MDFYYKGMVGLGALADETLPLKARVLLFYQMFGRPKTIWTTDEIAVVVKADGPSVKQARSRLASSGTLKKVWFNIAGEGRYTWLAADTDISLDALKVINGKAGGGRITYCTPGQQVLMMGRNYLAEGHIPDIFVWRVTFGSIPNLWSTFQPYLLDWSDRDVWEFWRKFSNSLRAKNHPLRVIRNEALRAQTAIACLEMGAQKNRERNPNFLDQIEEPHGWLLHGLGRYVGQEEGWGKDPLQMSQSLQSFIDKKDAHPLREMAERALARMEGKTQEQALVVDDPLAEADCE